MPIQPEPILDIVRGLSTVSLSRHIGLGEAEAIALLGSAAAAAARHGCSLPPTTGAAFLCRSRRSRLSLTS